MSPGWQQPGTGGAGYPGGPRRRSRLPWILGGVAAVVVIAVVVSVLVVSRHGGGSAPTVHHTSAAGLAHECKTVAAPLGTNFLNLGTNIEANPQNADSLLQSEITAFSKAASKASKAGYTQLADDLSTISTDLQLIKVDFDNSNPAGSNQVTKLEADAKTLENLCGFPTS